MSLTEAQQKLVALKEQEPQLSWSEVGKRLNIDPRSARRSHAAALGKIQQLEGYEGQKAFRARRSDATEIAKPEQAAAAVEMLSEPKGFRLTDLEIAERAGLTIHEEQKVKERLDRQDVPKKLDLEHVKTEELVLLFENTARDALNAITVEKLEKQDPYRNVLTAAISVDKRDKLLEKPTQRITIEDRRKIPELMEALIKDSQRRGITIDIDPITQEPRITKELSAGEQ